MTVQARNTKNIVVVDLVVAVLAGMFIVVCCIDMDVVTAMTVERLSGKLTFRVIASGVAKHVA